MSLTESSLYGLRPPVQPSVLANINTTKCAHTTVDTYDNIVDSINHLTKPRERALKPGGSAFFIDSLFEPTSTAVDHLTPDRSGTAHRRLNDGREFRIVKVFYEPAILEKQLIEMRWQGWVRSSGNFFVYGNMTPV
jgi:hypothetical protein